MNDLQMGAVFVAFFVGYLTWSGTNAVRHDLGAGAVGHARYAVMVRAFAVLGVALAPALALWVPGPILPGIVFVWFAWIPSILDPHWRRVEAPPLTKDAQIVSARAAHPARGSRRPVSANASAQPSRES